MRAVRLLAPAVRMAACRAPTRAWRVRLIRSDGGFGELCTGITRRVSSALKSA